MDRGRLSSRQTEVRRWVAQGYPNKKIGALLGIGARTVTARLAKIYSKLNVGSLTAASAWYRLARLAAQGTQGARQTGPDCPPPH